MFRENLKEQKQTPKHIQFRKDKIYHSIESKIYAKTNSRWQYFVAILAMAICSSGYWHYEQQKTISNQNAILNYQQEQIVSITNETSKQKAAQISLNDSLKLMQKQLNNQVRIVRLAPLPKIIINQPIIFKNTLETEHITIRYITINTKPKLQETKLPELDLPVVYESETLANNNISEKNSAALSKKIRKLLNN